MGSSLGSGRSTREGNGNPLSILAGIIPWTEEPGGYGPWDQKESDRTEHTHIVKLNSFKQQTVLNCLTLERMHLTTII